MSMTTSLEQCPRCGGMHIPGQCYWQPIWPRVFEQITSPMGWQCPRCSRCYAPFVQQCSWCLPDTPTPKIVMPPDEPSPPPAPHAPETE